MGKEEAALPEKLQDFHRNPAYERKVVVFYDVLGWRNKIALAGTEPKCIGELRRIVLLHSRLFRLKMQVPVNVSTFSDNVVVSVPPKKKIVPYLLRELAVLQLTTVSRGFLLRGGVTIGEVVHDGESVFGPALARAYDLESKFAKYPRIVIDQAVLDTCGKIAGFNAFEDGIHFLDPFTDDFISFVQSMYDDGPRTGLREAGLPGPTFSFKDLKRGQLLGSILRELRRQVRSPLEDKEWEKVAWLHDRIAKRLGVPLARSYPRVRPGDVVE